MSAEERVADIRSRLLADIGKELRHSDPELVGDVRVCVNHAMYYIEHLVEQTEVLLDAREAAEAAGNRWEP